MLYFIDNNHKMVKIKEELLNKTLYIPLEIIDREIDGGCLLAMEAVARGWKVIIGSQRIITKNIESNEIGIYFLKSSAKSTCDCKNQPCYMQIWFFLCFSWCFLF